MTDRRLRGVEWTAELYEFKSVASAIRSAPIDSSTFC